MVLIHPGLHKTGTTYLQDRVFAADPNFHSLLTHTDVDRLLVRPHSFTWSPEPARDAITKATAASANALPVLSSEILAGNLLLGARDAERLARRLHAVAPDARVLLTVRHQPAMAAALYQQYLKRGGTRTPARFFDSSPEPGYPGFDPTVLLFHHYVELYAGLWGERSVLVLPQEHLARDGTDFIRRVAAFAGRPVPEGWSAPARGTTGRSPPLSGHPLFRLANHLRPGAVNPGGPTRLRLAGDLLYRAAWRTGWGGQRERRSLDTAASSAMPDGVAASNQRLQRFCPIDLASLGFDVAREDVA